MITKTKKIAQCLIFTVVCLLATISSNAQMKLGASGGIALPMGDFGTGMGMGFGGGVNGGYMLNDNMGLGLNIGYFTFGPKDALPAGFEFKTTFLPITGSFEYYFATEGFKPYGGLDLGLYMQSTTVTFSYGGTKTTATGSASPLGFAPVVGFAYGLSDNLDLVVNGKYNYVMTAVAASTFLGVNVGINYIMK